MKMIFFLMTCLFVSYTANAQLPYSKILQFSPNELKEEKFRYYKKKNQYILVKNRYNLNFLSSLGIGIGININSRSSLPNKSDYVIVRQEGEKKASSLSITFYEDERFHEIQTWLIENNIDYVETNLSNRTIQKFNYNGNEVQIERERIEVRGFKLDHKSSSKTFKVLYDIDLSYYIYTYVIYTGIPPFSDWHKKEANKGVLRNKNRKNNELERLM